MHIKRARLELVLDTLAPVVGNKIIDICNFILVNETPDGVYFLGTNYSSYAVMEVPVGDDYRPTETVGYMVHFSTLKDLIKKSDTEDVSMHPDGGQIIVETNGTYKLARYAAIEEFLTADLTQAEDVESVQFDSEYLNEVWKRVAYILPKCERYPGVNFDGNFAATDQKRLIIEHDVAQYGGKPLLLPKQFGNIIKVIDGRIVLGMNKSETLAIITCDCMGLVVGIRLPGVKFVDYKLVGENSQMTSSVSIDKEVFLGMIDRAKAVMPGADCAAEFCIQDNRLTISADDTFNEFATVEVLHGGNSNKMKYDLTFVKLAVKNCPSERVNVSIFANSMAGSYMLQVNTEDYVTNIINML